MGSTYGVGSPSGTASPSIASPDASPAAAIWPVRAATPLTPEPETAWYVATISRVNFASSCSGFRTGIAVIVVQFGFAMMPFGGLSVSPGLTSETTSGTSGSLRQADELSTTMAPASATFGAYSADIVAPAEKIAMSMPVKSAVSVSSTTYSLPPHVTVLPAERAEEKTRSSSYGNFLSASRVSMTRPTWPVAPKTPTRMAHSLTAQGRALVRYREGAGSSC